MGLVLRMHQSAQVRGQPAGRNINPKRPPERWASASHVEVIIKDDDHVDGVVKEVAVLGQFVHQTEPIRYIDCAQDNERVRVIQQ